MQQEVDNWPTHDFYKQQQKQKKNKINNMHALG